MSALSGGIDPTWFLDGRPATAGAGTITVLTRADVATCLADIDTVAVTREALAAHDEGRCDLPSEAYLRWTNAMGSYTRSLGMPAAVGLADGSTAYGMKIINASVGNPRLGLDRASGIGLCFDPETARITTIAEVGLVSAVRTAAVSAVAIDAAGYADAETLSVLGCGVQGGTHLALLLRQMPGIRAVTLFDADPPAARRLADRMTARHGAARAGGRAPITVTISPDARSAVGAGRIVITTTTVDEGYIASDWIGPGSLVVNVSLADLCDETLLAAGAIYVDDIGLVRDNPRRPLGRLMQQGKVAPSESQDPGVRRIDATIGGLLTGRYLPVAERHRYAVVNPFGMGLLDVALLHEIQRRAAGSGLGTPLRME